MQAALVAQARVFDLVYIKGNLWEHIRDQQNVAVAVTPPRPDYPRPALHNAHS